MPAFFTYSHLAQGWQPLRTGLNAPMGLQQRLDGNACPGPSKASGISPEPSASAVPKVLDLPER